MKPVLMLLIAFCLIITASGAWKIQAAGGEFGRAWLGDYEAQKNENKTQEDEVDPLGENGAATGNDSVNNSSLGDDWLGGTEMADPFSQNNATNGTAKAIPFATSKTFGPHP